MYLYTRNKTTHLLKFNYASGLLVTDNESFDLDDLREYLLIHAKEICSRNFIGVFIRPGTHVEQSVCVIDGKKFIKKEVSLGGAVVSTYDWDTIFFTASKTNLIRNFIDENTRNRDRCIKAASL